MSIVHNRSDLWNDPYLDFRGLASHISSSVKIRSWTATLQTSSETPPKSIVQHYYTTHFLNTSEWSVGKCKELSNLGWEVGKWWAKSGEMYCTFSRHGRAIQLKPASAQLGFIFNFVFPSIFCPSRPSTQTAQMPNWCKMQNYNGVDKRFNGTVGASLLAGVKGQIAKSKLSLQTNQSRQKDDFFLECVDEVCFRYADNKQRGKHNGGEEEHHKISEV